MKKANKFEITIDIHKKICVTRKMVIIFVILVLLFTLIVSNGSPETFAVLIRILSSVVSNG